MKFFNSRLRVSTLLILSSALYLTACELDGGLNTHSDASTSADQRGGVDTQSGVDSTQQPDTTASCSFAEGCLDYRFVRVDDLSDMINGEWPGADIDTVILVKQDGRRIFANAASQYQRGGQLSGDALNPNEGIGAPDSFENYPNDTSECSLYKDQQACEDNDDCDLTFVALGGVGGYLIVDMPEKIEQGDQIQVLEVGGCEFTSHRGNPGTANSDPVKVQISVSDDPDGSFVVVADSGTGPVITATVPSLPEVPAN